MDWVKDSAIYLLVRSALWLADRAPLERGLAWADRLADLGFRLSGKTRRLALEHLELIFGDRLDAAERERIACQSLRCFFRGFIEAAKIEEIRPRLDSYISVRGWDEVRPHIDRGAVVCSGHIGNWELLAAYIVQVKGLPVAAVARRLDEDGLNQLLEDFRHSNGVETILRDSGDASRQILRVLKNHGLLAMLIDLDTKVPSITVPFLGHPARTPVAPAALAVRRNLPLVVAYALQRPEGGHELVIEPPLFPDPDADRDQEVRRLTERANELLGAAILAHPDHWAWWHRRWRRRPVPRLDPDASIH